MSNQFNTIYEARWDALKDGPALSALIWDAPSESSYGRFAPKLVEQYLAPVLPIPVRRSTHADREVNLLIGPPGWIYSNAYRISKQTVVFTMNETTAFPSAVLPVLNTARAVVLPTLWAVSHLSAQWTLNLHVCPLGVEPDVFYPSQHPDGYRDLANRGPFIVSTIADATSGFYRKGLELLIEAFKEVFPFDGPINAVLLIRCSPSPRRPVDLPQNAFYIDEELSEAELVNFIHRSDVGVFPSRGEGFCLPALEYIACGKPIAVSDFGTLTELYPEAYRIRGRMLPAFGDYEAGFWLEPSMSSLKTVLKTMHADSSKWTTSHPTMASKLHASSFALSWKASALKLRAILSSVGFFH